MAAAVFSCSCSKASLTEPSGELRWFSYLVSETKKQSRGQTWGSIPSAGFRMPPDSSRGHETMFSWSYLRPGEGWGGAGGWEFYPNKHIKHEKKKRPEGEFQWSIAMGNLIALASHVQQSPQWKKNDETHWTLELAGGISQRSSRLVPKSWVWQKGFK